MSDPRTHLATHDMDRPDMESDACGVGFVVAMSRDQGARR